MNAEKLLYHIERAIEARKFGVLSVWPHENEVYVFYEDFVSLVKTNGLKITIKKRETVDYPFEARTKLGDYTIYALFSEKEIVKYGLQDFINKGERKHESV